LEDVKCYLFNDSGAYLGEYKVSSSEGETIFNLADGDYRIRIDHMGYQFWTADFTVPDTLSMPQTISHQDVMISVQGDYDGDVQALGDIKVYLFTPSGSYLGRHETTDSVGEVFSMCLKSLTKCGQTTWASSFGPRTSFGSMKP